MAINTPLGDTLDGFLNGLLAGRSAITQWKALDSSRIYSKVGGDLSDYDVMAKLSHLADEVPADVFRRLRKLVSRAPWSTRLSMLLAVDGYRDAGLFEVAANREFWLQYCPLGRIGSVDEVAKVVLFLASDAASYTNGQAIAVNGGLDWAP